MKNFKPIILPDLAKIASLSDAERRSEHRENLKQSVAKDGITRSIIVWKNPPQGTKGHPFVGGKLDLETEMEGHPIIDGHVLLEVATEMNLTEDLNFAGVEYSSLDEAKLGRIEKNFATNKDIPLYVRWLQIASLQDALKERAKSKMRLGGQLKEAQTKPVHVDVLIGKMIGCSKEQVRHLRYITSTFVKILVPRPNLEQDIAALKLAKADESLTDREKEILEFELRVLENDEKLIEYARQTAPELAKGEKLVGKVRDELKSRLARNTREKNNSGMSRKPSSAKQSDYQTRWDPDGGDCQIICGSNLDIFRAIGNGALGHPLILTSPPYFFPPGKRRGHVNYGKHFTPAPSWEAWQEEQRALISEMTRCSSKGARLVYQVGNTKTEWKQHNHYFAVHKIAAEEGWCSFGDWVWDKYHHSSKRQAWGSIDSPVRRECHEYVLPYWLGGEDEKINPFGGFNPMAAEELAHLTISTWKDEMTPQQQSLYEHNYWKIAPAHHDGHAAIWPLQLAYNIITMFSQPGQTVIDPHGGSGSTAIVATLLGRKVVHIDAEPEYCDLAKQRVEKAQSDREKHLEMWRGWLERHMEGMKLHAEDDLTEDVA